MWNQYIVFGQYGLARGIHLALAIRRIFGWIVWIGGKTHQKHLRNTSRIKRVATIIVELSDPLEMSGGALTTILAHCHCSIRSIAIWHWSLARFLQRSVGPTDNPSQNLPFIFSAVCRSKFTINVSHRVWAMFRCYAASGSTRTVRQ